MKRIFGLKKKEEEPAPKGPSLEETSTKMGGKIDEISEKLKKCDEELKVCMTKMRENPRANASYKQKALQIMKRKKLLEQQHQQLYGTQFNLDQMQFATENMQTNLDMVSTMKEATGHLKQEMGKIDMDELYDQQEDMAEMM